MRMDLQNPTSVIFYMIIACIIFMIALLFWRQVKGIFKIILSAALGLVAVYVINFIVQPFGIAVGVNIISALVIGFLGIPGLASLYLLQFIL